jgi:hypothetical protein
MPEIRNIDTKNDNSAQHKGVDLDELAGPKGGIEGRRLASYWLNQITEVDDDKEQKRWAKRGIQIEKRYRDERNRVDEEGQRRYNALWSNIEILTPALYGKVPVPVAERRFRDKDPVGRGAAQILERSLRNEIEICGFDEAMQQAVRDYLIAGRGTVWVRYEPQFEEAVSVPPDAEQDISDTSGDIEGEDDSEDEVKLRETGDRVARESTPVDFIQWTDFYAFPSRARVWSEVVAVGKRTYMTRDQMKRRFGDEIGKAIPLQKDDRKMRRQEDTSAGHEVEQKAQVYEIWSRTDEAVFWVAEGYSYLCDRKDDPYKLERFFPCPKPLFSNPTNNTLVPVPDFVQYQDQAIQIDELTQRISMLAKACKVAGVYNAAAKSIQRLLNESVENELIPVDDWAAFADKGGVAGNISLLPLKEIMGVLNELQEVRDKAILDMDRLTGISDIMRGTTDARETVGGQRLKTNATGTRLQHRQNEVARFARDALRIMADVMCQHFSPQSLIEVSGALYEEGLGTMDMPSLTMLQQSTSPPPGSIPPGGPVPGPLGQPPPSAPSGPSFLNQQSPNGLGGPPQMGMPQPPTIHPKVLDRQQGLQRIAKAIELLRNERLRGFRVDIEVDSTIYGDTQQEKGDRTAFIASVTQFMQQAMQISAAMPEAAPLLGKFLQFGVRGFKVGRDLEQAIEDFCDEAVGAAKRHAQMAAQQPNPEQMKAEAAMLTAKTKAGETQQKAQIEQQKAQADIQSAQMKMQSDQMAAQAEVERQQIENQGEQANSIEDTKQKQLDTEMRKMEMQIKLIELEIKKIEAQAKMQQASLGIQTEHIKADAQQQSAQADIEKSKMDVKTAKLDHEHQTEEHKLNMKAQKQQHAHDMERGELDIKKAKASANKLKPEARK